MGKFTIWNDKSPEKSREIGGWKLETEGDCAAIHVYLVNKQGEHICALGYFDPYGWNDLDGTKRELSNYDSPFKDSAFTDFGGLRRFREGL
jgi:hypothetical protein